MATGGKEDAKGLGGILGGLTEFVESLQKLAESGGELTRSGSFPAADERDKEKEGRPPIRGIYGFSVKVGAGGKEPTVEPFGNLRRDRTAGTSMSEEREPLVDIFDEDDRLLIVAEMPGVEPEDLKLDLNGETLTLSASRGDHKYRKSIEVPAGTRRDRISISCRNGIIEVACAKAGSEKASHENQPKPGSGHAPAGH
jgi:HSP20 family protein